MCLSFVTEICSRRKKIGEKEREREREKKTNRNRKRKDDNNDDDDIEIFVVVPYSDSTVIEEEEI